jgi:O-Antigen ligase
VSSALAAPLAARTQRLVSALTEKVFAAGAFTATAGLAAANGGFFPVSWGWAALALFWAAAAALIVRDTTRLGRLELVFVGFVTAVVAWTWLSSLWSIDLSSSILEGQRGLVVIGAVVAAVALAPARPVRPLLGAVLAGVTVDCGYALATRLFPARVGTYDQLAVYRLNTPVGYWNGLGIFAALGAVLALGFAVRGRRPVTRALASASLLVLVPTLYFTFSRGAWLAAFAGLAVLAALDARRLQLAATSICVLTWPALGVVAASRAHALTRQSSILPQAVHDGHRLAVVLLALAAVAAAAAVWAQQVERRVVFRRPVRLAFASVLVGAALLTLGGVVARYGSPPTIARKAYDSFLSAPKGGADLNARLFTLSNDLRIELWRVAWQEAQAHPVLGGGAGSYDRFYAAHRSSAQDVQDAHNLYLETLAELGPAGLALLLAALAVPLVAAVRLRRHPLVPFAAAAYSAYLVHASVDWDWELAGITAAAIFCGLACLLAARREHAPPALSNRARNGLAVGVAALGVVALLGLVGNSALGASETAIQNGDWSSAVRHARTATRWLPWSAAGWQRLGEAQIGAHEPAAARRSLQRALARDPGDWVTWLDLGIASRGRAQSAAFARASRLNPRSPLIAQVRAAVAQP